ncbi:OmpA family protein [Verrucomicrobia bacterium]|nr:OmpA family protein [Verrucomicrobiota bacterium]
MGGAWKVAYADLVTGLFALFMCLWLTSVDEDVMEEISKYFRNPNTVMKQATPGMIDTKNANVASSRKAMFSKPALIPKNLVRKTTEDIEKSFVQSSEFLENKNMHIEVVEEGVKATLFDTPQRDIFGGDEKDLSAYGEVVVDSLGTWLSRKHDRFGEALKNVDIEIEGHAAPDGEDQGKAWRESIAQAVEIRKRLIEVNGVNPANIKKVVGYGPKKSTQGKFLSGKHVSIVIREDK